jgi:TonB-linked SusC/RagA family outer membrane protein
MKLSALLMILSIWHVVAEGSYGQAGKVSLNMQNAKISDVFDAIEKQSKYEFFYNNKQINVNDLVSVKVSDSRISDVLNNVLSDKDIAYQVIGNRIILVKQTSEDREYATEGVQKQQRKVTGVITDGATGETIIGANILVKGTTQGVITDVNGNFSIAVSDPNATLVVSYVGYASEEVALSGRTNVDVKLVADIQQLNEVVVTALGIKRQAKALGYSTSQVSGSQFSESRDVNLGNALTGKIAGVSVSNNSTGATGSSRVVIRGNASLTGNNMPLYVVDGVPFDNTNQGSAGQYGGLDLGDGLSNIDPDDIESIQVLKGAAASALYGFRGGNGAILITTKSGSKSKKVEIEVNNNLTFNSVIDTREFQYEYGQGSQGIKPSTQSAALATAKSSWGAKIDGSQAVNFLGNTYSYNAEKDNWKNFYKTGINNQSSISLSGGSDQVTYRIGFSNLYNKSNIPNANMQQQGINMNTVYNITKKLQLTVTANYVFEDVKNRSLLSDNTSNANATLLYIANTFDVRWLKPAVKDDGSELLPGNDLYFNNPYFVTQYHQNRTKRNRLTGAATLKYNIADWLYVQGQVSRDGYIFDFRRVTPTGTAYAVGGELTEYERNYHEINSNFLIGLNKDLNDIFSVNATFGGNSQNNVNEYYGLNGTASPFIIPYLYTADNIANKAYTHDYARYEVNSLYGTADFGFKKYLFLNFTGRNDWFSTLSKDNNHYFYPSVSSSFIFSDAFSLPSWISFGKLRAAYAEASNGTSPYQNKLAYGLETYTIDGQSVGNVSNSTVPNANLKPVQIQEREIGLNMQFFNNRIGFDASVYQKKTTDDIATVSASTASGYSSAIMNVGKVRNTGFEGLLNTVPVLTSDFKWDLSFNVGFNTSKVLYLGDGVSSLAIDGAIPSLGTVTISNVVGLPYGQIMGYKYKRDSNGNKIYDSNGIPIRTSSVVPLGSGSYKTTGGISNEIHYKNFSFSCLVDFKFGGKIYSATNARLYYYGLHKNTLQGRDGGFVGEGVTESGATNTTAVNAETYFQTLAGSNNIAEEFVYDASFIKLRQLTFGYTLPSSILQPYHIKGVQISFVARNLATLLKHTPNIDPESGYNNGNGQGLEGSGNPATRSIGFNLNVKF